MNWIVIIAGIIAIIVSIPIFIIGFNNHDGNPIGIGITFVVLGIVGVAFGIRSD